MVTPGCLLQDSDRLGGNTLAGNRPLSAKCQRGWLPVGNSAATSKENSRGFINLSHSLARTSSVGELQYISSASTPVTGVRAPKMARRHQKRPSHFTTSSRNVTTPEKPTLAHSFTVPLSQLLRRALQRPSTSTPPEAARSRRVT